MSVAEVIEIWFTQLVVKLATTLMIKPFVFLAVFNAVMKFASVDTDAQAVQAMHAVDEVAPLTE